MIVKPFVRSMLVCLTTCLMIVLFGYYTDSAVMASASDYITDLTVSAEYVENNEKVRVEVSFSDGSPDEHVFHGGDTIDISWPSSGEAYLKGFKTNIPLISSDGITYGTVEVKPAGARITFSDAVNDMYDVTGHFYFDVMAVNAGDTTEENTQTVSITAGSKTVSIDIHKGASAESGEPGELPDFRKEASAMGGWTHAEGVDGWAAMLDPEDPTYTEWILTANENKGSISSDIVIHDVIEPGQAFDSSSVTLYSAGSYNKLYEGSFEEVTAAYKADFPASSLTVDSRGNMKWVIEKSAADGEAWYFKYRCDITDFSLALFENSADISWTNPDGSTYSGHSGSAYVNIDQGGDAAALPRGVLQITKRVRGTALAVSGVKFTLEKQADSGWEKLAELTADEQGKATQSKLKTGHYRLYETYAPDHLEMEYTAEHPYEFDLDLNDPQHNSLGLTVENAVKADAVTATKTWKNGDGSPDTGAHPVVYMRLYRIDKNNKRTAYGGIKALENGITSATWENVPQFDVFGNRYVYEACEVDKDGNDFTPEGYIKEESGTSVVNTKTETVDISGRKTWNDGDDRDGIRPESITVHLMANGEEADSCTVKESDNWAWSFEGLPKYDTDKNEIVYTITEDAVAGYTAAYDGYNITNTYTPGKTSISVSKNWDDEDDRDGVRPKSVTVKLLADKKDTGKRITLSEDNNWRGVFDDLNEKENGRKIIYTVEEAPVNAYDSTVSEVSAGAYVINNHHDAELIEYTVEKEWDDDNDRDGLRPESIRLTLCADGEAVKEAVVVADSDGAWNYTFTELPKYRDGGKKIEYSITEKAVAGYETEIKGNKVVNRHTPEPVPDDENPESNPPVEKTTTSHPDTGDSSQIVTWIILVASSALALKMVANRHRKKQQ